MKLPGMATCPLDQACTACSGSYVVRCNACPTSHYEDCPLCKNCGLCQGTHHVPLAVRVAWIEDNDPTPPRAA